MRPNLSINATGAPLLAGNPERARTSGARRAHTPRGDADKNANAKSRHQDSRLGNRGSSRGPQRSRRNVSPTQSRAPSQSHVQTPPPPPHAPTLHGQAQIPSVIDSGVSKTSEAAPNSSLQTMSAAAMAAGPCPPKLDQTLNVPVLQANGATKHRVVEHWCGFAQRCAVQEKALRTEQQK